MLDPAPGPAVDDGAEAVPLVPPGPPTPPPMTAPVVDGLKDDVGVLKDEEDEDCVCEEVELPVLDEAVELVRLADVIDGVEEAPLICDELDLVDVTIVLLSLVVKEFRSRALVPMVVVLGFSKDGLSASCSVMKELEERLLVTVELPPMDPGESDIFAAWVRAAD